MNYQWGNPPGNKAAVAVFVVLLGLLGLAACAPVPPAAGVSGSPAPGAIETIMPAVEGTAPASPPSTPLASPEAPTEETREEVTVPATPSAPVPSGSGLEDLVAQAKEDLAGRLAIDTGRIELVELSSVVWPDASLGCPQPDMLYKQVPQDGALIRLSVEGTLYEYHSGGGRGPFLCEPKPLAPKSTAPPQIDIVPSPGSEDQ